MCWVTQTKGPGIVRENWYLKWESWATTMQQISDSYQIAFRKSIRISKAIKKPSHNISPMELALLAPSVGRMPSEALRRNSSFFFFCGTCRISSLAQIEEIWIYTCLSVVTVDLVWVLRWCFEQDVPVFARSLKIRAGIIAHPLLHQ